MNNQNRVTHLLKPERTRLKKIIAQKGQLSAIYRQHGLHRVTIHRAIDGKAITEHTAITLKSLIHDCTA